jgi:hypothetical protein
LGGRYFLRVRDNGQGQLAVSAAPVTEEQTSPTRRRTAARQLLAIVAVTALTIGLFWAYLLQSRTQAANSDAAGMVVEGWDMLHGNLLLRGWFVADVSFYTFEVPLDGLISVVYGLRTDVVHVAAAAEYALLVLLAALVAAGARRDRRRGGREAWVRGLIAAGVMVAPGAYPGAHVLLLGPDHTAIGVPVLAVLLAVDRLRPRRLLPVLGTALLVCLLLIWAQLDDPVAEFSCALPLALACAVPLAAFPVRRLADRIRRRRGRLMTPPLPWRREAALHGYDLALVLAALASLGLTQLAIRAINNAGGYYLHAIPAKSQISQWSTVPAQVHAFGLNLMYLFGANFWGQRQPQTAFAYVHLAGVAVALLGLLTAIWSWPRANRVTRTFVVAVFVVFAAGSASPLMAAVSGAHEIAIMLPFGAVLAGRSLGPWLAGRRPAEDQPADVQSADAEPAGGGPAGGKAASAQPRPGWFAARAAGAARAARMAAACVLIAAGVGYLADLGYNAAQPSSPAVNQNLAAWLVAHNLTSGIGGYWDANITMLGSGGQVRIAPLVDAGSYGYLWESKASWFDPDVSYANFIITHVQQLGAGYQFMAGAIDWYGKPSQVYYFGNSVILVYDHNLLQNLIQPLPGELDGP